MSLRDKAVPLSEICEVCIKVEPHQVATDSMCRKCSKELWVPLKDAQKAFVDNEALFKAAYIKITELEAKVEAANKILDNPPRNLGLEGEKLLDRLRECFSQEQKKEAHP